MKVLVTGAGGMLGSDIMRLLPKATAFAHDDLDITDLSSVVDAVSNSWSEILINCAAYTAVDRAETEQEKAFAVNRDAVSNLAQACKVAGMKLVHVSTDYVFDGEKTEPYIESDPISPASIYGKSKALGEIEAFAHCPNALVVRTSWLYGHDGPNFVKTILKKGLELKKLNVVDDQFGAPTFTQDLAQGILNLVKLNASGLVNVTNSGSCNWYQFAKKAVELSGLDQIEIAPIGTDGYPTPAKRPKNSRLDMARYQKITGERMRTWDDALVEYIEKLDLGDAG